MATVLPDVVISSLDRLIPRAESLFRTPYMPYQGPEVAAFNPMQNQAMRNTVGAAQAFGMAPQNADSLFGSGIPEKYLLGGMGYSSAPLYENALASLAERQPSAWGHFQELYPGTRAPSLFPLNEEFRYW